MIVATCQHDKRHKHGVNKCGTPRYKCALCGKTFVEETALGEMRTSLDDAAQAIALLLEGMSVRSVQRVTGLCRETLANLIVQTGESCQRLLDGTIRSVDVKEVQLDELWSFVGAKQKTVDLKQLGPEFGDSWTFIAIERHTKLILAHQVGQRDTGTCWAFLLKLKTAVSRQRFQVTSDGLRAYKLNVPFAFGSQVDFAQLIKVYGHSQDETRYSPARIISSEKLPLFGEPEDRNIITSHIERLNLTVRMTLRRFTRLTNAHSKSRKHHAAMQSIFVAWYNFARKHESLKGKSPAMASGIAGKVWTLKELLERAGAV